MSFKLTALPDYLDTIVFQTSTFYEKNSNLLDVFSDYLTELNLNLDYEKGKSSGDFLKSNNLFFNKLNEENFIIDGKELDEINKNYYIEKYNSLFNTIKSSVSTFISDSNIYFKNYSDDVGILTDSICVLDDSIIPWYDIFNEDIELPNYLNSTIFNKTSNNNKSLQLKFSKFNNAILKNNLQGIVDYDNINISKSESAHGNNLVTDYYYYKRFFLYKEQIAKSIGQLLKGLGDYILYIKNLNLRQNSYKSTLFNYDEKIEDIDQQIDLLQNKISSTAYKSNLIIKN